jgi:uncharacterized repeat protein (TIGR02543 family)
VEIKMKKTIIKNITLILCLAMLSILFACNDPEDSKESYMVTFSRNLDNVTITDMPSPQNIVHGEKVSEPTKNPSTQNYNFIGWFSDSLLTTPFEFSSVVVTQRLTIYAGWELKVTKYGVSFDLNYTSAPSINSLEVISGQLATKPTDPVREGYQFMFWSTQKDAEFVFNFDNPITETIELFAIWRKEYQLTYQFNLDGRDDLIEIYVESENTVRPSDPIRPNFSFGGWFSDEQLTIPYQHNTKLTEDKVIYAKWVRVSYVVTFDLNYLGSNPIVLNVNLNADVPTPTTPVREGYVFDNWYTSQIEQTESNLYDFAPVTNDLMVIYASWKQLFTVTFDFNYEGAPDPVVQTVKEGLEANIITPSRLDYLFSGWYIDLETTQSYGFDPVNESIRIYAKWTDASQNTEEFTVTFDLNYEGSTPIDIVAAQQTVVVRPEDPVREGYQFSGWMTTQTGSITYKFNPVTEDITVYARWVNIWNVSFNYNYDNAPVPTIVQTLDGTRINRPENPVRSGLWQFITWNDENSNPFVFTTIIQRNIELTAVWVRSGYSITWNFNYDQAPAPSVTDVLNGTLIREPDKPNRIGNWAISGWYLDQALTQPFSLSSELTQDITLYAKWASGFSYRIDFNYIGAPSIPTQILSQGTLIPAKPTNPVRNNFTFMGWSDVPNGDPTFDGFGTAIQGDLTIYAQWRHTYVFEAEYVNLMGKSGAGWSGGAAGTAMIIKDTLTTDPELGTNANASNGYFLSYLYSNGLYLDFNITSDRQTQATLILRLSAEQPNPSVPFMITDDDYLVTVNGQKVNYGSVLIEGAFAPLQLRKLPFEDLVVITINLNQGLNVIRLMTNNQNSMGGTMESTAPLLDCIKIDTIAVLTWQPVISNLSVFD